jgi:hypothetical protein
MAMTNTPGRTPEPGALLPVPEYVLDGTALPDDWVFNLLQRALAWQMKEMMTKPSKTPAVANARARDIRTMSELVRIVEKLDAAARRRESKGRKAKARDDQDFRQVLIRRLDMLLTARDTDELS